MKKQNIHFFYLEHIKSLTSILFLITLVFSQFLGGAVSIQSNEVEDLPSSFPFLSNKHTLCSYDEQGNLQTWQIFNADDSLLSTTLFSYDHLGRLIKTNDEEGNGFEKDYDPQGNLLTETLIDKGNLLLKAHYTYDPEGNLTESEWFNSHGKIDFLPTHENPANSNAHTLPTSKDQDSHSLFSLSHAWQGMKTIGSSLVAALNSFKQNASYTNYMKNEWNDITEQFFDKGYLQFGGYYLDPIESGSSTGVEINDKVRVTFINGILNIHSDLEMLLRIFSSSHGDIPIHYVFRPTKGWTKDILTCTLSKMGFISPYAKLLAKTWKELIQEMGGVGQGGKIIHYAHSIGATDTYVARSLLTAKEQEMIQLITLGSPTIIPIDSGFSSVTNYISKRDGVCLLDPIGYYMGILYGNSKIELIGSSWGIPLIDHTLYTDSYGELIKELGAQFLNIYQ